MDPIVPEAVRVARTSRILLVCVAAALAGGACSAGPAPTTATTVEAVVDPAPPPAAAPADATGTGPRLVGPADTRPKEIPGGYPAVNSDFGRLTDVRVASQDGFDRIVLQFDSALVPSWKVGYVAPPVTTAESGEVVPVAGAAFLQVAVAPAGAVAAPGDPAGPSYAGPDRITSPTGGSVREFVKIGDWEAALAWTAGTTAELPFAVATLRDPARLVIDVVHPGT